MNGTVWYDQLFIKSSQIVSWTSGYVLASDSEAV